MDRWFLSTDTIMMLSADSKVKEKAYKMMKDLQNKFYRSYGYFSIFNSFKQYQAPNIYWEEQSQKNVDMMNHFKNFYSLSVRAHYVTASLELSKIFDKNKKSASIYKLAGILKGNASMFTTDTKWLCNLIDWIEKDIDEDINYIDRLKEIRNKKIAHNDIDPEIQWLSIEDFDYIFSKTHERLNAVSSAMWGDIQLPPRKIFGQTWEDMTSGAGQRYNEAWGEAIQILDRLQKYEEYRLKEMKK